METDVHNEQGKVSFFLPLVFLFLKYTEDIIPDVKTSKRFFIFLQDSYLCLLNLGLSKFNPKFSDSKKKRGGEKYCTYR